MTETSTTTTEIVHEKWDEEKGAWVKDHRTVETVTNVRPAEPRGPWRATYDGSQVAH